MEKVILLLCLPLMLWGRPEAPAYHQSAAQQVLNRLYKANGNTIFLKPNLKVSNSSESVASYSRRSNTITIEKKVFNICRQFGSDSLSALAFILGHELSHAFQEAGWEIATTSYLARNKSIGSSISVEKNADVGGLFMAYLAGYNSIDLAPQLIQRIYKEYDLMDRNLTQYPSLSERMQTGKEVQALTRDLIQIFETGNYLMAIEQFDMALSCFTYVEKHYKGREVYNNLGLATVERALNFSEKNIDGYLFPFEMNWKSRLRKPRTDRGEDGLSKAEQLIRRQLLHQAEVYFETARKMDLRDFSADLNLFCVKTLLYGAQQGYDFFLNKGLSQKAKAGIANREQAQKLSLVLGIAYASSGQKAQAYKEWEAIIRDSDNVLLVEMARWNLAYAQNPEFGSRISQRCLPIVPSGTVDGVRLHRTVALNPIRLTESPEVLLSIQPMAPGSTVIVMQKNGVNTVALHRVRKTSRIDEQVEPEDVTMLPDGYMAHCAKKNWVARVQNGWMREYVMYYSF